MAGGSSLCFVYTVFIVHPQNIFENECEAKLLLTWQYHFESVLVCLSVCGCVCIVYFAYIINNIFCGCNWNIYISIYNRIVLLRLKCHVFIMQNNSVIRTDKMLVRAYTRNDDYLLILKYKQTQHSPDGATHIWISKRIYFKSNPFKSQKSLLIKFRKYTAWNTKFSMDLAEGSWILFG